MKKYIIATMDYKTVKNHLGNTILFDEEGMAVIYACNFYDTITGENCPFKIIEVTFD